MAVNSAYICSTRIPVNCNGKPTRQPPIRCSVLSLSVCALPIVHKAEHHECLSMQQRGAARASLKKARQRQRLAIMSCRGVYLSHVVHNEGKGGAVAGLWIKADESDICKRLWRVRRQCRPQLVVTHSQCHLPHNRSPPLYTWALTLPSSSKLYT